MRNIFLGIIIIGAFTGLFAGWSRATNCQVDYINQWGVNVSVGLKVNGVYTLSVCFTLTNDAHSKSYMATFLAAQMNEILIDVVYENTTQPFGTDHYGKVPYALGGIIGHK